MGPWLPLCAQDGLGAHAKALAGLDQRAARIGQHRPAGPHGSYVTPSAPALARGARTLATGSGTSPSAPKRTGARGRGTYVVGRATSAPRPFPQPDARDPRRERGCGGPGPGATRGQRENQRGGESHAPMMPCGTAHGSSCCASRIRARGERRSPGEGARALDDRMRSSNDGFGIRRPSCCRAGRRT